MVHEKSRLRGFQKTYVGRLFSGYLKYPLSWGFLRVLGAWMTFKKADMAKTLKTRFSMIETNPLNHKWLDFVILTGLVLHQFQTKWLLRVIFDQWPKLHLGLDALSNQQILNGTYCITIVYLLWFFPNH